MIIKKHLRIPYLIDSKEAELLQLSKIDLMLKQIAQKLCVGKTTLTKKAKELQLISPLRLKKKNIDKKKLNELLNLGGCNA